MKFYLFVYSFLFIYLFILFQILVFQTKSPANTKEQNEVLWTEAGNFFF